jgi:hypothetical protein
VGLTGLKRRVLGQKKKTKQKQSHSSPLPVLEKRVGAAKGKRSKVPGGRRRCLFDLLEDSSVQLIDPTEIHLQQVLIHCTHYTLYTVHCTLYTVHYTLYTVHCTLYTRHCTLYTMHCTLYTILIHYTLYTPLYLQVLGAGSFGEVVSARWHGVPVAVKRLFSDRRSERMSMQLLEDFLREAHVLSKVQYTIHHTLY